MEDLSEGGALLGDCVNDAGDKFHPVLPILGLKGAPSLSPTRSFSMLFFRFVGLARLNLS